jgi:hypothetical protein
MKLLAIFLPLLFITTNAYAKEVNLLCKGNVQMISSYSEKTDKEINFSFDDKSGLIRTEQSLFCINGIGKPGSRHINKDSLETLMSTEGKTIDDEGYCNTSIYLNRNSGSLSYTKEENFRGLIVLYLGKFQCELAKQKF